MSDVSLEWHFWVSECPVSSDGDGSTQTMAIFHHTWQQKLLASPSRHSLLVKMGFTQVKTVRATLDGRESNASDNRWAGLHFQVEKKVAQQNQRPKGTN